MNKKNIYCYSFFLILLLSLSLFNYSYAVGNNSENIHEIFQINGHSVNEMEMSLLKDEIGVFKEGINYNSIVEGHGTGLMPPTEEEWQFIYENICFVDELNTIYDNQDLPVSVDNSSSKYFPPVGNQFNEGSCTCWAIGYYTKTYQEAKEHDWDLSGASWEYYSSSPTHTYQDMIFSPDFLYHQINHGIDKGSSYFNAFNIISQIGIATWEDMPYNSIDYTSWPSEMAWRNASLYRGELGYNYIKFNEVGIDTLKELLASGNLAVFSIDSSKYRDLPENEVLTLDIYTDPFTNHANTIVGYDDDISYIEGGEVQYGAFKIVNSWGTGWWGDHNKDGFFYISYAVMEQVIKSCLFVSDIDGYCPKALCAFELDFEDRDNCIVSVNIGDSCCSGDSKKFISTTLSGSHPFPDNKMVMDVSEFYPITKKCILNLFNGTDISGIVDNFSLEIYHNGYTIGSIPDVVFDSEGTHITSPVNSMVSINCPQWLEQGIYLCDTNIKIGVEDSLFSISASFYDALGRTPIEHKVIIDGCDYFDMSFSSGEPFFGSYIYETFLSIGHHTIQFHFIDQDGLELGVDNVIDVYVVDDLCEVPVTPVNMSPLNKVDTLTPTLESSNYLHTNSVEHLKTHWQICSEPYGYCDHIVWENISEGPEDTIMVPYWALENCSVYYWHVRYQDESLNWSGWSDETHFSTKNMIIQLANDNGVYFCGSKSSGVTKNNFHIDGFANIVGMDCYFYYYGESDEVVLYITDSNDEVIFSKTFIPELTSIGSWYSYNIEENDIWVKDDFSLCIYWLNYPKGPWLGEDTESVAMIRANILEPNGQICHINPNWNLVSFSYLPEDPKIDVVLESYEGNIDYIYLWNPITQIYEYSHFVEGFGWAGDFNEFEPGYGYWFHSTSDIAHYVCPKGFISNISNIDLYSGWNLVSWQYMIKADISSYLGDIEDYVDYIYRWNSLSNEYEYSHFVEGFGWAGDFNEFEPNYGYWFHCIDDCTWVLS